MGAVKRQSAAFPELAGRSGALSVIAVLLLLLTLALAASEGFRLFRSWSYNRAVTAPSALEVDEAMPPELLFVKAAHLDHQGQDLEALRLYSRVAATAEPELRERARYNMASLYLRQASKLWNSQGVWAYTDVTTLLDLAEDGYRKVLRADSENWDARYNLEYALRIRPPLKEQEKSEWHGTKSSVFSTYPGIPGGAP